jgi:hypothetical protein
VKDSQNWPLWAETPPKSEKQLKDFAKNPKRKKR